MTKLLPRSVSGTVPAGARSTQIVLKAQYSTGSLWNDGYADELSLTLALGPAGEPRTLGSASKPLAKAKIITKGVGGVTLFRPSTAYVRNRAAVTICSATPGSRSLFGRPRPTRSRRC